MSLFTWREEYAVHHAQIDKQHQILFSLADGLHTAMMRGSGRETIALTLNKLVDYTAQHFREEEALMLASGFPGYAAHKVEHDQLARQVMELKNAVAEQKLTITLDTMEFLRNWLDHHIKLRDQQIAHHIARKAAAIPAPVGAR